MDAMPPSPPDVLGPEPVVLTGLKDIAHLVRTDRVHVLVVSAHLFPLQMGYKESLGHRGIVFTVIERQGETRPMSLPGGTALPPPILSQAEAPPCSNGQNASYTAAVRSGLVS